MKKTVALILCLFFGLAVSSCDEAPVTPDPADPVEIVVAPATLSVEVGESASSTISDGNGGYSVAVTAGGSVASAVLNGNIVKITGLAKGDATVTVTDSGEKTADITVTVTEPVPVGEKNPAFEQNMERAMALLDKIFEKQVRGDEYEIKRWWNPFTNTPGGSENASVWMYTGVIEAVNTILHSLEAYKEQNGMTAYYDTYYNKYLTILTKLYANLKYYRGTYPAPGLVSFAYTKQWSVYGVNRSYVANNAGVTGVLNVYDDQEWLIRELIESYHLTGNEAYLTEAEYLTEYVIDGWDCTLDGSGKEYGGIPWGPGYTSTHACSNGPFVSPLVWLHEIYKDSEAMTTYRYIGGADKKTRLTETVKKSDHYLNFAKKVYNYHKTKYMNSSQGVYNDMCGSSNNIVYETIDGVQYRAHTNINGSSGTPLSYNSGTMLSGAADLYRVTGDQQYLTDGTTLTGKCFSYFAKPVPEAEGKPGCYYYNNTTFVRWFDCVLFRGYMDMYPLYGNASVAIDTFQANLDYAYENYNEGGFLPQNLPAGWDSRNTDSSNPKRTELLANAAYVTEYAGLARYELEKAE